MLSATLSIGPDHGETELDALMARLRPPDQLVILRDTCRYYTPAGGAESPWSRTSVREAKSERLVATTILDSAVMKASYPGYDEERAALG